MIKAEKIDLFAYFDVKRYNFTGGFLTVLDNGSKHKTPALLIVAGGGYDHISLREQMPVAMEYIKRGFRAFILDYSVKTVYPYPMIECGLAMAYLRKNAKMLGIIEDKIIGIGFSAGGHLLGCLGTLLNDDILLGCFKKMRIDEIIDLKRLRPDAMILCYPVVNSDENKLHEGSFKNITAGDNRLIDLLSLEKRVDNQAAPAFIWHTANDRSVPVFNSLTLALSYERVGVSFSLHIYTKGRHGLSVATSEVVSSDDLNNSTPNIDGWINLSIDFLSGLALI